MRTHIYRIDNPVVRETVRTTRHLKRTGLRNGDIIVVIAVIFQVLLRGQIRWHTTDSKGCVALIIRHPDSECVAVNLLHIRHIGVIYIGHRSTRAHVVPLHIRLAQVK